MIKNRSKVCSFAQGKLDKAKTHTQEVLGSGYNTGVVWVISELEAADVGKSDCGGENRRFPVTFLPTSPERVLYEGLEGVLSMRCAEVVIIS